MFNVFLLICSLIGPVVLFAGFPVDRMLDPPLDPMYGDMKERDRSMLGRVRERSPLMDKRGDKYRRGES